MALRIFQSFFMTAQDNEGGSFEPEGFSKRFLDYRELSVKNGVLTFVSNDSMVGIVLSAC